MHVLVNKCIQHMCLYAEMYTEDICMYAQLYTEYMFAGFIAYGIDFPNIVVHKVHGCGNAYGIKLCMWSCIWCIFPYKEL